MYTNTSEVPATTAQQQTAYGLSMQLVLGAQLPYEETAHPPTARISKPENMSTGLPGSAGRHSMISCVWLQVRPPMHARTAPFLLRG